MRTASAIIAILLYANTASAQLCGPEKTTVNGPAVTWNTTGISMDFNGELRTVMTIKYETEGKLIPQMVYTYPAYSNFKKMIKSIRVLVEKNSKPAAALIGNTPGRKELKEYTVAFHPLDSEMTQFIGTLDLSTAGWDSIDVRMVPNSAIAIDKKDYANFLIEQK